jgi:SAM-dependent methyltransferase
VRRVVRPLLNRIADAIEWLLPDWNPDAAWRYLPMARALTPAVGRRARVLDVGAGGVGIAPYVPNPCVLTDAGPAPCRRAPFVQADCLRLPFPDRTFPAVVSADLLEHLAPAARPRAVAEMLRVTKRILIVAAPTGEAALEQDRYLRSVADDDSSLRGFLDEHLACGLPQGEELVEWVTAAAPDRFARPQVRVGRNANLTVRRLMMRGIVAADEWGAIIRVRLWTPLAPLLSRLNTGRCYRTIVACWDADAHAR